MEGLSKMLLLALQRSSLAERLEKGILFNKDKPNLVDGRNSESNRRKFKYMKDNRCDEGEWGIIEYNITVTVRTEEGGQESRGQSKEGNGAGTIQRIRRGLRKEVDI